MYIMYIMRVSFGTSGSFGVFALGYLKRIYSSICKSSMEFCVPCVRFCVYVHPSSAHAYTYTILPSSIGHGWECRGGGGGLV